MEISDVFLRIFLCKSNFVRYHRIASFLDVCNQYRGRFDLCSLTLLHAFPWSSSLQPVKTKENSSPAKGHKEGTLLKVMNPPSFPLSAYLFIDLINPNSPLILNKTVTPTVSATHAEPFYFLRGGFLDLSLTGNLLCPKPALPLTLLPAHVCQSL